MIFKVSTAGSVAGFGGHLRSRSYIGESNCPPDLSMNFDSDNLCDLVIYCVSAVFFSSKLSLFNAGEFFF